jgi:PAS domain S-box-containing protein
MPELYKRHLDSRDIKARQRDLAADERDVAAAVRDQEADDRDEAEGDVDRVERGVAASDRQHASDERAMAAAGRVEDAKDRAAATGVLLQSEERYRLLVEGARDYAIFSLDTEGNVTSWNTGAQRIIGHHAKEILGRHLSVLYGADDNDLGKAAFELAAAARQGSYKDEGWRIRTDGTKFWADVVITALHDEHGKLLGYSKLIRDITQRREAEEEIRRLNADLESKVAVRTAMLEATNKELEAFTYTVSHDLRAPVRVISSLVDILLTDYAPTIEAEAAEFLQDLADNAQQMGRLIEDLLTFSQLSREPIKAARIEPLKIAQVVVQRLLKAEPAEREIEIEYGDLPECRGDPSLLTHVYTNLLSNALKYTRSRPIAKIKIGWMLDVGLGGSYFVRDNGVGFDMAYHDKLFGVFQRLQLPEDYEGTGVGLAIVQRIITRHGGRVWAEGHLGDSATFYFTVGSPKEIDK